MKRTYILKWFDDFISDTLNPNIIEPGSITPSLADNLLEAGENEKKLILSEISSNFFYYKKEEAIRLQARNYYSILHFLIETCREYEIQPIFLENPILQKLLNAAKGHIQEIFDFITLRFSFYFPHRNEKYQSSLVAREQSKISVRMSVDQLSLIIRAAFENEVFVSKSMNELYKIISPLLSTTNTYNISFKSLRSKAYTAETTDKEIVVSILTKLIESIKTY